MEARTKNPVEEETCFFRDGKRGIGNSLLIVELARLPPFVTVKLSPFISLQIEKKIISNSDNIDNQPKQRESLLYQNLNSIKRIPTVISLMEDKPHLHNTMSYVFVYKLTWLTTKWSAQMTFICCPKERVLWYRISYGFCSGEWPREGLELIDCWLRWL